MNSALWAYKRSLLTKNIIGTHRNSNSMLEDLITKDYENIVNEKPEHLFNVNFRVLMHGVRVVDNKIRT
jgi:hypothetical protein